MQRGIRAPQRSTRPTAVAARRRPEAGVRATTVPHAVDNHGHHGSRTGEYPPPTSADEAAAQPAERPASLLKRVSQVRILPGAHSKGPAQEGFPSELALRRDRGRATRVPLQATRSSQALAGDASRSVSDHGPELVGDGPVTVSGHVLVDQRGPRAAVPHPHHRPPRGGPDCQRLLAVCRRLWKRDSFVSPAAFQAFTQPSRKLIRRGCPPTLRPHEDVTVTAPEPRRVPGGA